MTPAEVTVLAEIEQGLAEVPDVPVGALYDLAEVRAACLAALLLDEREALTRFITGFNAESQPAVVGVLVAEACAMAREVPRRGDLLASLPSQVCDLGGQS